MNHLKTTEGYFFKAYYMLLFILNPNWRHAVWVYVEIDQRLDAIAKFYEDSKNKIIIMNKKLYNTFFKKLLIMFKSDVNSYYNIWFILGMLLIIQILTGILLNIHYIFNMLNAYNVITLQNMQNENFVYCIQGGFFGASLEQLKIKIFTQKGVKYMKQHDALFKNAFSKCNEKIVLGKYHLFNTKYRYIRYSLFIISVLFTISIILELNILSPVLFSFVYCIRTFFLGWLGCSVIAASFSELKVRWSCWLDYRQASRLLVLDGIFAAGISAATTAVSFGIKMAPPAAKICVGLACAGLWVIDPIAVRLGYDEPFGTMIEKFAPFAQKYGPEWGKNPNSPHYVPRHRGN